MLMIFRRLRGYFDRHLRLSRAYRPEQYSSIVLAKEIHADFILLGGRAVRQIGKIISLQGILDKLRYDA